MNSGILRAARAGSLVGIRVQEGSKPRACSRCHSAVLVAPLSIRIAAHLRPVCDVCLPAEPVGPVGL